MRVIKRVFASIVLATGILLGVCETTCTAQEVSYEEGKAVRIGWTATLRDTSQSSGFTVALEKDHFNKRIYYKQNGSALKKVTYKTKKEKEDKTTSARSVFIEKGCVYSIVYKKHFKWIVKMSDKRGNVKRSATVNIKKAFNKKERKKIKEKFVPSTSDRSSEYYPDAILSPTNVVKVDKNQVDILYRSSSGKNDAYRGGIIRVNLNKGTAMKWETCSFCPYGYYGDLVFGKKYSFYPNKDMDEYYICKDMTIKKNLYKIPVDYGVEESKCHYGVTTLLRYDELPDNENDIDNAYSIGQSSSFKNGNLMFSNLEGIFYVSCSDGKPEKVLSYKNMTYYSAHRYLYSISMKNKKEFTAIYTNDPARCTNALYGVTYTAK